MKQILKNFIDNDEAKDAYVTSKVTYISLKDVETLLDRQEEQLRLCAVGSRRELLIKFLIDNDYEERHDIYNITQIVEGYLSKI